MRPGVVVPRGATTRTTRSTRSPWTLTTDCQAGDISSSCLARLPCSAPSRRPTASPSVPQTLTPTQHCTHDDGDVCLCSIAFSLLMRLDDGDVFARRLHRESIRPSHRWRAIAIDLHQPLLRERRRGGAAVRRNRSGGRQASSADHSGGFRTRLQIGGRELTRSGAQRRQRPMHHPATPRCLVTHRHRSNLSTCPELPVISFASTVSHILLAPVSFYNKYLMPQKRDHCRVSHSRLL